MNPRDFEFGENSANINVLITISLRKSWFFLASVRDIWSTSGVLQLRWRLIVSIEARQPKHGDDSPCTRKMPRFVGRAQFANKKLSFTIASLLNDMIIQLHELNDYRTPYFGFFVWLLLAPKNSSTATRNWRCITDSHLVETEQTLIPIRPEHQQRQREDQQFKGQ